MAGNRSLKLQKNAALNLKKHYNKYIV